MAEKEIADLRDKLRIMTSKNEELEKRLADSSPEIKRLNDRLEEQRGYAAIAMTHESEMRDKLSHELNEKRLLEKRIDDQESEKHLMSAQHARLEDERDGLSRRIMDLLNEIESLNFSIRTLKGELTGEHKARAEAEGKLLSSVNSHGSLKSMASSEKT